jgi:polyisoprenoid-binding protein YceI
MNTPRPLLALAAVAAVLVPAACADPVGDAPRAQVQAAAPHAAAAPQAAGTRYTFSEQGSKVSFVGAKITNKHEGGFKKLTGTIDVPDGRPELARVDVVIDTASIYTDNPKLTGHLQGADFFDVAKFPTARFTSTSIAKGTDGTTTVTGDLTMHGVTQRISFPAQVAQQGDTATATAAFGINRKDFGLVYPGMPDDLIKDEVLLQLDVQAKRAGPRS